MALARCAGANGVTVLGSGVYARFQRSTDHEHPNSRDAIDNYREILTSQKLAEPEIAARVEAASQGGDRASLIVPEVERLLGPARPVEDVLASLDRQYKEHGKPAIYFLGRDEPKAPHLDQLLGPAKPSKEVFDALDRQYREQGKPAVWFLPLTEPIAPHLDELLGTPSK